MILVVGIAGPSGSGKTTVARRLSRAAPRSVHLQQDLFFVDPACCEPDANFCEPEYLHEDEFLDAATRLASGASAVVPTIDFSTFRRTGKQTISSDSSDLVIIEGMTIYRSPALNAICDIRYYLAPSVETIISRKTRRDAEERRKTAEELENQLIWVQAEYKRDLSSISSGAWGGADLRQIDSSDLDAAALRISTEVTDVLASKR